MTPERYHKIGEHYRAVQELEPGEREAYLEQACADDDEMRWEVETLLSFQSQAESFIEQPALKVAAQALAEEQRAKRIGQHLSHYQILSLLGVGGMGEVYLARDTLLGRQVAIKFLPAQFTTDAERVRRFEREARAASALNHPNIITIYEIGRADETHFIVTEYIEGETLRQWLRGGRLTLSATLDLAIQVAAALAAAHEAGITHRDIKPENVMVRRDQLVKVLDFGLAKLTELSTPGVETQPLTAAHADTKTGVVMGTPRYMSPEQARGQRVDARTDIFSLGVVLYEMLAGQPPFMGETVSHIIVAILEKEPPPLTQFVKDLPAEFERIIKHALAKPAYERYASARDLLTDLKKLQTRLLVEVELERGSSADKQTKAEPAVSAEAEGEARPEPLVTADLMRRGKRRQRALIVTLAVLITIVAAMIVAFTFWSRRELPPEQSLLAVPFTTMEGSETTPTFSPDGNQVAFSWNGESGENFDIYVQVVGSGTPLRLTKDPAQDTAPAWSPDGRYIAFIRSTGVMGEGVVYLVSPLGGAERKVAEGIFLKHHEYWPTRLGWAPDGKTLFFSELDGGAQGIFSVEVETGQKRRLTAPPPLGDYSLAVSPDGETVAFARLASAGLASSLWVAPIRGGEARRLAHSLGTVTVTWMPDGKEIVYAAGLYAGVTPSLWKIAVAGGEPRRLPILGDAGVMPVVSPSGRRLIYVFLDRDANLWRYDRPARDGDSWQTRKLTTSTHLDSSPQISPDGRRIAFASTRSGSSQIWVAESDGSKQHQLTSLEPRNENPRWSPDGRSIAFDARPKGNMDIYVVDAQGGAPRPIVALAGDQDRPSWSHDGKWIYFASGHTGTKQIWKVPAAGGNPIQVTRGSGEIPFESADGRFVYYVRPGERTVWRAPVEGGEEVAVVSGLSIPDRWDVVAEGIYFVAEERDASSRSSWALKLFRFDTQKVSVVTKLNRPAWGASPLDVSPDGKWFVWVQADRKDSDLMLVENFR